MNKGVNARNFNALICLLALFLLLPSTLQADARTDGDQGIEEYRKGNLIEGMQLLEKSAAQGYAPAQTTLAYILDASEQDADAFHWYQQAAESNDAAGLFGLGGMYIKGEGTVKDPIKGGQLIEKAAQFDHVQAMRVYARALEHGQLGIEPDQRSAAEWYLKAASLGDQNSMLRLKKAYTLGQLGLPVDPQQVEAWDKKINQPE
jgi:TPR repeat protein